MYDHYKDATIEINLPYLSEMITAKAKEMGTINEQFFIRIESVESNDAHDTILLEGAVFKFLEN